MCLHKGQYQVSEHKNCLWFKDRLVHSRLNHFVPKYIYLVGLGASEEHIYIYVYIYIGGEGGSRKDFHQFCITIEQGIYTGGGWGREQDFH